MNRDSYYKEPDVIVTMKCPSCGETLLFGLEHCRYCGAPIDEDYARRSAAVSTFIHRAVALANTIRTGTFGILVLIPSAIGCYLMNWRTMFVVFVLLPSVGISIGAVRWGYKYGDIKHPDQEFIEAQKKITLHIHAWLAFITVQVLLLLIW